MPCPGACARDEKGLTPLHWAAWKGRAEVFRFLLSHGADWEAKDDSGHTVLEFAAAYGHQEIVDLLLEKGADPQAAMTWAARQWQTALFERLLARGYAMPALSLYNAVRSGNLDAVRAALERGADVNEWGADESALMEAARLGHNAIVALLLAHGADPNLCNRDGFDALGMTGKPEIKDLLKQAVAKE